MQSLARVHEVRHSKFSTATHVAASPNQQVACSLSSSTHTERLAQKQTQTQAHRHRHRHRHATAPLSSLPPKTYSDPVGPPEPAVVVSPWNSRREGPGPDATAVMFVQARADVSKRYRSARSPSAEEEEDVKDFDHVI